MEPSMGAADAIQLQPPRTGLRPQTRVEVIEYAQRVHQRREGVTWAQSFR